MYNQGDIVIVPFPFSNLKGFKPRPVVIISNSLVNEEDDVIVAQITSKLKSDKFSFMINNDIIKDTLILDSEVRCHKIFTIDKTLIKRKVSEFDDISFKQLIVKIQNLIN